MPVRRNERDGDATVTAAAYDAVLLAGGAGRRLGGARKPTLQVGGRRLVDVAVSAATGATRVVLVGPDPGGLPSVTVVREHPPGTGPVAGIAAGLAQTAAPYVLVLATDLPFLTIAAVGALRRAIGGADVALLVDGNGADQHLVAFWRRAALVAAIGERAGAAGRSVRSLLAGADVVRVPADTAGPPAWYDCDTQEELDEARRWL